MSHTLKDIKPGESCVVVSVGGGGAVRRRLFDMGITPNTDIYVQKLAPLGDPIEITVRGYELSLRKSEAEQIVVNPK